MERFSPAHLLEDQLIGASAPLYWALAVVFTLLLIAGLYVYLQAPRRFPDDRFHRRLFGRYAKLVASFSGLGAASTAFAMLAVPFLSKRLWLAVALVGLTGTAMHAAVFARRGYRTARRAAEEQARRERYRPRPKSVSKRRRRR